MAVHDPDLVRASRCSAALPRQADGKSFPGDAATWEPPYRQPFFVITYLAFAWPTVAIAVQRFHDRGRSGWPVFAFYAVATGVSLAPPWLGSLVGEATLGPTIILFFLIPVSLWFLIMLAFADGTPGPNRFGPSPKGSSDALLSKAS